MRKHKNENPHVPAIVVTYLGRLSLLSALISGFLVWRVVETSSGSKQAADAAVIGVVMAFIAVTTGSVAVLGSILASTRGGNAEPPTPVVVQNAASDPVPTTEAAPPAADPVMPDPDGADPGVLTPAG